MDDNCGEWVECMGMASGNGYIAGDGCGWNLRCGCKEVYKFPHITYPYSSCIRSFFAASLHFVNFLKCFSFFRLQ